MASLNLNILTVGLAALAYLALWVFAQILQRRDFRKNPEKNARYLTLPTIYKAACWCIIVPLWVGTLYHFAFFIAAVAAQLALEIACINWYKRSDSVK